MKMGAQVLLTLGAAFFPFGLYLQVENPQSTVLWLTFIALAAICWIGAIVLAQEKEREERRQRRAERNELHKLLVNIHNELKRLTKDKKG